MNELPQELRQCPKCHAWAIVAGYEPGTTWAECEECGLKVAVPDEDWKALDEKLKELKK